MRSIRNILFGKIANADDAKYEAKRQGTDVVDLVPLLYSGPFIVIPLGGSRFLTQSHQRFQYGAMLRVGTREEDMFVAGSSFLSENGDSKGATEPVLYEREQRISRAKEEETLRLILGAAEELKKRGLRVSIRGEPIEHVIKVLHAYKSGKAIEGSYFTGVDSDGFFRRTYLKIAGHRKPVTKAIETTHYSV